MRKFRWPGADAEAHELPELTSGKAFLPWLMLTAGAVADLVRGDVPLPWLAGTGLLAFVALYVAVTFRAFDSRRRTHRTTLGLLAAQAAVTYPLALGYGGSWIQLFLPLALACGTVLRGQHLVAALIVLGGSAGVISGERDHDPLAAMINGYGTFISGVVTAAILGLAATTAELRRTREELARSAVDQERLRFARDLHDLLGHSMSVIVVKAEAVRRLAERDPARAAAQASDIETVGRQALTEIREAVTGYRESSLATELDRARSALTAAGMSADVQLSGPPLDPESEAVLGWVVREATTNVVRHSGATRVEIVMAHTPRQIRLEITDNGTGPSHSRPPAGSGLRGMSERLAEVGSTLVAQAGPEGGFRVSAELRRPT
ncbi:two-component system, NarL family, sensor histidine kinase DesK [Micromonospora citrea]|uniref:Two-component system, NarL family, sensor histidine kinase DesK n=1 Tax=Micromonospora citrea TaxID=47855 RepID=A0A1C6V2H7_9ACTN|nr:sensor histidine kinase [Micromonospora citrea]SCL60100.1 two-component system, NarL family, sensor histidine kinase DesK [Micromonospora citrea]